MQSNNFSFSLWPIRYLLFAFQKIHHHLLMTISFYGVFFLLLLMLFPQWFAPYTLQQIPAVPLLPTAWSDTGEIDYFLGTDNLGRDVLSRLIYGTKNSFGSAIIIMLIVNSLATVIGVSTGILSGLKFVFFKHFFDLFLFIPGFLLAIIMVTFFEPGIKNAIIAITLALLPRAIHTITNAVHQEMNKEYVIALRLDGADKRFILKESILPNIMPILIRESTHSLTMGILDITTLGFLGLGAQPPEAEWGAMLRDTIDLFFINPSTLLLPGIAILVSVLLVSLLGSETQRLFRE